MIKSIQIHSNPSTREFTRAELWGVAEIIFNQFDADESGTISMEAGGILVMHGARWKCS